jgi:hypothetical protein
MRVGQVVFYHRPYRDQINAKIMVNEDVSHADNVTARHTRVARLKLGGQCAAGFADDFGFKVVTVAAARGAQLGKDVHEKEGLLRGVSQDGHGL